jgi:hypothetical protein
MEFKDRCFMSQNPSIAGRSDQSTQSRFLPLLTGSPTKQDQKNQGKKFDPFVFRFFSALRIVSARPAHAETPASPDFLSKEEKRKKNRFFFFLCFLSSLLFLDARVAANATTTAHETRVPECGAARAIVATRERSRSIYFYFFLF